MSDRTCSIAGCDKPARAKWCSMHEARIRRGGTPERRQPPRGDCSVEGCDRPHYARTWCTVHYDRWKKHGTTKLPERPTVPQRSCAATECDRSACARGYCDLHYRRVRTHGTIDLPHRSYKSCRVDNCDKQARSLGLCLMHYTRLARTGDPLAVKTQSRGKGPDNPNWCGDQITYTSAHFRVRRERGPARDHNCIDCGQPAIDWSYDHTDQNEQYDKRGYAYSGDITHYDPRCKTCHNKFDQRSERARMANGRYASASGA